MVYRRLLLKASEAVRDAQFELDTHIHIRGLIDEVSILFKHEADLEAFVRYCQGMRMEHFNSVPRDKCMRLSREGGRLSTHPSYIGPSFDVRFEFLRWVHHDWRIEAMCVLAGEEHAPLHAALPNHSLVHVSFKCADFEHYIHTAQVLQHTMSEPVEYRNSYGVFGYFGAYTPYLKPRVNLRDVAVA